VELYSTFLLPSDDPATHPYVTYDNVMAWRALLAVAGLLTLDGAPAGEVRELRERAARLRSAVYRHCVVPAPEGTSSQAGAGSRVFAWSVNLEGRWEIADEPPGSLELLPYYGFCGRDDPVWLATMAWLHGPSNPFRYAGEGVAAGQGGGGHRGPPGGPAGHRPGLRELRPRDGRGEDRGRLRHLCGLSGLRHAPDLRPGRARRVRDLSDWVGDYRNAGEFVEYETGIH